MRRQPMPPGPPRLNPIPLDEKSTRMRATSLGELYAVCRTASDRLCKERLPETRLLEGGHRLSTTL